MDPAVGRRASHLGALGQFDPHGIVHRVVDQAGAQAAHVAAVGVIFGCGQGCSQFLLHPLPCFLHLQQEAGKPAIPVIADSISMGQQCFLLYGK